MTQASLIAVEEKHAEVAGELVRRAKSAADLSDGERGELTTRAQERSVCHVSFAPAFARVSRCWRG
jgi:hypothetical protein